MADQQRRAADELAAPPQPIRHELHQAAIQRDADLGGGHELGSRLGWPRASTCCCCCRGRGRVWHTLARRSPLALLPGLLRRATARRGRLGAGRRQDGPQHQRALRQAGLPRPEAALGGVAGGRPVAYRVLPPPERGGRGIDDAAELAPTRNGMRQRGARRRGGVAAAVRGRHAPPPMPRRPQLPHRGAVGMLAAGLGVGEAVEGEGLRQHIAQHMRAERDGRKAGWNSTKAHPQLVACGFKVLSCARHRPVHLIPLLLAASPRGQLTSAPAAPARPSRTPATSVSTDASRPVGKSIAGNECSRYTPHATLHMRPHRSSKCPVLAVLTEAAPTGPAALQRQPLLFHAGSPDSPQHQESASLDSLLLRRGGRSGWGSPGLAGSCSRHGLDTRPRSGASREGSRGLGLRHGLAPPRFSMAAHVWELALPDRDPNAQGCTLVQWEAEMECCFDPPASSAFRCCLFVGGLQAR